ncbi:Ankyrin repeats (3 copies) family protein [Acanthocheilonema viteae]
MVLLNIALALLNCLLALPSCFDPTGRCLNGGVCLRQITNEAHSTMCSCSAGYSGEKCEKIVDICEAFPHYCNAGTCVSVNGSAVCHCSVGYFGQNCEYSFDKCKLGNICRNGGTCIDDICLCMDGFSGELCERHVPERDDYLRTGCEEYPEFCSLRFADETCNDECNNEKCFFDGFDCVVNAQKCRLSDYCALHYMDGKCDEECAVPECGYDGMDCDGNTFFRDLTESNTIGIIFDVSPTKVLDKIYSLLSKLAQKLHNPVHLALDNNNKTRIYEWSFENGIGKQIDLKKRWEMSRNTTGVLIYVDIDSTFCKERLHLNGSNFMPCFTDIFGATAYLYSALYDEDKNRISLDDVTVERLFVESSRSRSLPVIAIFFICFVLIGITLSCFYGIYGFCDVLKKRNLKKNRAPVWKVPSSLESNVTSWSTLSSVEDYCPDKNACRRNRLPSLSELFSNSFSWRQEQPGNVNNGNGDYYLGSDLLKAIKCNDIKGVSFLVLHGADVNCSDSDNNTALHHAVIVNNDQIIRLLLSTHRCNLRAVNILGQTPLILTVRFSHVSDLCARCILDFMYTEYYRQAESVNGTSTSQRIALIPQNGSSQSMLITPNNVCRFDPSLKPAGSVGCVSVQDILSEKNDPTLTDIFGRTALHYAALNRRIDLLPMLHAFGLKLDTEDSKGETPLYLAAREGHVDVVNLLLSFGANSRITDQLGRTPLDVAKERRHYLIVELLENVKVNNVDIPKTLKKKRIRKPSCSAKGKSKRKSQIPVSSSQETMSLISSNTAIASNVDYMEDIGDINDDMAISNSFLNSIESFVLTPPGQILAEAEKDFDLDVVNPDGQDYIDLSTISYLPSEFFPDDAFSMESFEVRIFWNELFVLICFLNFRAIIPQDIYLLKD